MDPANFYLPAQNSTVASDVDALFNFILYLSYFFFIVVTGGSILFAWKYRQKGERKFTPGISHNTALELFWTIVPTILVFIIFVWGFNTYLKMSIPPGNATEVKITAQKWFWTFSYENGITTTNELVIPVNKPYKMLMSSTDVIHSFYVPSFRTKMDVLPNRYTGTWFEATATGSFDLFCTEYCGKGHSEMIGKVTVLSEIDYEKWIVENNSVSDLPPEELGAKLYQNKACFTCHTTDGNPSVGPSFKGIFGRVEKLTNGTTITVDENYLRKSILEPQSEVVEGFQPVMPTYQSILKPEELDALIAYLKTVK